jgi:hypothetical protein
MQPARLADNLPPIVGTTSRDRALFCCRHMARAFEPERMPPRPIELEGVTRQQLDQIREKAEGGRQLETPERNLLSFENQFNVSRATITRNNLSRLRGAMWCVVALRHVLREDPSDREAEELGSLLVAYLRDEWRVPGGVAVSELERAQISGEVWQQWAREGFVPESLATRSAIADLHIAVQARVGTNYAIEREEQQELYA